MKRAINKPMGKTRKLSPNLLSTLAGHFSPLLLRVFHCSASCESFERIFQEMALSTQGNSNLGRQRHGFACSASRDLCMSPGLGP